MKVILNKDLSTLGEEGDIKEVAKGFFRNYLLPRGIAFPFNERTAKIFEARKDEIEARKAQKRMDAASLKEKIEALAITITMPAGANGKLYGAVTAQTVADELAKAGFQIERKKIEIPGNTWKSVGKYKAQVKLYESEAASVSVSVEAQEIKTEAAPAKKPRRPRHEEAEAPAAEAPAEETPAVEAPAETPAPEEAVVQE
jgi:large subunit ribosomal protein L9